MTLPTTEGIFDAIRIVETALIDKNYLLIGSEQRKSRLTAEEIEKAVNEYGGIVTQTPDAVLKNLKVVEVGNATTDGLKPSEWHVDLDLYIDNKRSDLTISMQVVTQPSGNLIALVEDLHVM